MIETPHDIQGPSSAANDEARQRLEQQKELIDYALKQSYRRGIRMTLIILPISLLTALFITWLVLHLVFSSAGLHTQYF